MSGASIGGEEAIIQGFLAPLAAGFPGAYGLKDDCAAITPTPGHDLIVKTDPVAEGVHFFADDPPEDIGWKALAVNVSDLAAKGAKPVAYLMALSFPVAPTRDWMQRFAAGLGQAQSAFGIHLIGGDTDRRPGPITISITVFGEVKTGEMVRRGEAQAGDIVCVSGTLGDAALGLRLRQAPERAAAWGIDEGQAAALIARYRRPKPALALTPAVRAFARAAMDLSDGLLKDLDRMCRASGVGAQVQAAEIPVSAGARTAFKADPSLFAACVSAGDDYELLLAVAPEDFAALQKAAEAVGRPLHAIGTFTDDAGVEIQRSDGTPLPVSRAGWDHF